MTACRCETCPSTADALVRVLERRDETRPRSRASATEGRSRRALREQLVDCRRDLAGLDLREARQAGKIK